MKKLIFSTALFPGDAITEKVFVEGDLEAFIKEFDEIILVPTADYGRSRGFEHSLPKGVTADWEVARDKTLHSNWRRLLHAWHPFVLKSLWAMRREARTPRQWAKGFCQAVNTVLIARDVEKIAKRHGMTPSNGALFSMWYTDAGSALSYLGLKQGWRVATRMHREGTYDEQLIFRSRTMRDHLMEGMTLLAPISRRGEKYLHNRYPRHRDKTRTFYLGSRRFFEPTGRRPLDPHNIRIVTVARLHPIKKIPETIRLMQRISELLPESQISWTLIGDGPLRKEVEKIVSAVEASNFTVDLAGEMPNTEVQKRMAAGDYDWLVLMSADEGVPVCIGEAMSYAIPAIATDVGDTRELATPECGILVPKDYDGKDFEVIARSLAAKISDAALHSCLSKASTIHWEEIFNARKNAGEIGRLLAKGLEQPEQGHVGE